MLMSVSNVFFFPDFEHLEALCRTLFEASLLVQITPSDVTSSRILCMLAIPIITWKLHSMRTV